jgi:hypothetical protein
MNTETITRKNVEAQYLSKGMVLATGEVVTHSPYIDSKTPSGKTHLGINGFRKTWNKRTVIAIKDLTPSDQRS